MAKKRQTKKKTGSTAKPAEPPQPFDYRDFMEQLGDPKFARTFMDELMQNGYEFENFPDVETMSDEDWVEVARSTFPFYYLIEYPLTEMDRQ